MASSSPASTSQVIVKAPSLTSWNCYEKGLYKVLSSASSKPRSFAGGFATAGGLALLHFGVLSVAGAVAGALCLVPAIIWGSILVGYLPRPRGKHEVGSFDFEVKLPSMDDETETYALPVTIFFPAAPATRSEARRQRRDWLPSPQDEFMESFGSVYGIPAKVTKALLAPLRSMKMQAYETQTIASGTWPVLLFSHGLYGTRTMYSAYCTEMASQGYVVLAPEHVDGTAAFVRSSTHALPFQKGPAVNREKQLQQRVKELEAIWHHLSFLHETRFQPAGGSLDLTHCALTGHSFGGATALLATEAECFRGRCTVTMMDPWLEPAMQLLSQPGEMALAPTLTIMTASMLWEGNAHRVVEIMARSESAGQSAYMTELIGARHQDISDLPFFLHIPNGVLTASSMTRLGTRIWSENADLVLYFLQARGLASPDLDTKLRSVANVRIYDWKLWINSPQAPPGGEHQSH